MIELQLFDRAQVALRHCALMKSGDQVLLVSDGTLSPRILNAFATAAHADGARPSMVTYTPQRVLPMKQFSLFAGMSLDPSPAEPPSSVRHRFPELSGCLLKIIASVVFLLQPPKLLT